MVCILAKNTMLSVYINDGDGFMYQPPPPRFDWINEAFQEVCRDPFMMFLFLAETSNG